MLLGPDFDALFIRSVRALAPYLADILCIGGCANALYRYHRLASSVPWDYVGTKDFDIALPQTLPDDDRAPIAVLMAKAGFKEQTLGTAEEPVVKYVPEDEQTAADLEFLCDLSGLPGGRKKQPVSYTVQGGLQAQPLRYLGVLFSRPWTVQLGRVPGFEQVRDLTVGIPNPAAYVFQKIRIRDQRRRDDAAAKDCFYIYEVSVVFRDAYDAIRDEYRALSPCAPKWKRNFEIEAKELFGTEDAEGPLSVVDIAEDSATALNFADAPPTTEAVCRSVNRLLDAMVG